MYIIDSNKDFYDYVSHIYGVDKNIVFDRRGSQRIEDSSLTALTGVDSRFSGPKLIFIEIGEAHYLVKLFNFKFRKDLINIEVVKSFNIELFHKYPIAPHKFDSYISIHNASMYPWIDWNWKSGDYIIKEVPSLDEIYRQIGGREDYISNPIFVNTSLTKVLDASSVWIEIQTYISSLDNDKDIESNITDKEKVVVHGFDKYSFRHPIK